MTFASKFLINEFRGKFIMGKFLVTEILINGNGKEIRLEWDYHDRFPTEKEKQATRDYLKHENIKFDVKEQHVHKTRT